MGGLMRSTTVAATFVVVVAAMLLTIGGVCKGEETPTVVPEALSEKCKTCISSVGKAASEAQWKAVEECLYWAPGFCSVMQEHKESVLGVFMARMNPYSYASGYCMASPDCSPPFVKSPPQVDTSSLQSVAAADLFVNLPNPVQDDDAAVFLAPEKIPQECARCSRDAFDYMNANLVPQLVEGLCAAGERHQPATLLSYVDSLVCEALKPSQKAARSFFAITNCFMNSAFGSCRSMGC